MLLNLYSVTFATVQHRSVVGSGGVLVGGAATVGRQQLQHVSVVGAGGVLVGGAATIGRHQLGQRHRIGGRGRYHGRRLTQRVQAAIFVATDAALALEARACARRDHLAASTSAISVAATGRHAPPAIQPRPIQSRPIAPAPRPPQRVAAALTVRADSGLEVAAFGRRRPVVPVPLPDVAFAVGARSIRCERASLAAGSPQLSHRWTQRAPVAIGPCATVTHLSTRSWSRRAAPPIVVPTENTSAADASTRLARTARTQALAVALIDDDDI